MKRQSYPIAAAEPYDVAKDSYETTNLAAQYPELVGRLKKALSQLRQQGHS